LKGKIFKFMSDILKDGSYYKLYTQAKSTSACGLPKGFFFISLHNGGIIYTFLFVVLNPITTYCEYLLKDKSLKGLPKNGCFPTTRVLPVNLA